MSILSSVNSNGNAVRTPQRIDLLTAATLVRASTRQLDAALIGPVPPEGICEIMRAIRHSEQCWSQWVPQLRVEMFKNDEAHWQILTQAMLELHVQHGRMPTRTDLDHAIRALILQRAGGVTDSGIALLNQTREPLAEIPLSMRSQAFALVRERRLIDPVRDLLRPPAGPGMAEMLYEANIPLLGTFSNELKDLEAAFGEGSGNTYGEVDACDLLANPPAPSWVVERVMTANEPLLIGGLSKTMKTSVGLDLAVSLATATPFLGFFPVVEPKTVLFMSGESGKPVLAETLNRICAAKSVSKEQLQGKLIIADRLPKFGEPQHHARLRQAIRRHSASVSLIDPAYRVMPAGKSSQVVDQGDVLGQYAELCLEQGCIPALMHHFSKGPKEGRKRFGPPEIEDFSGAGYTEFLRNYLLLGRRRKFEEGSGIHFMWLVTGGSNGHSACRGMTIQEGQNTAVEGREWSVITYSRTEAVTIDAQAKAEEAANDPEARTAQRAREKEQEDIVLAKLREFPAGLAMRPMAQAGNPPEAKIPRMGPAILKPVLDRLVEMRLVEKRTSGNGHIFIARPRLNGENRPVRSTHRNLSGTDGNHGNGVLIPSHSQNEQGGNGEASIT